MFGFSDYTEYRRHEQELDHRAEQARVAREQRDAARRQATERRAADRAARARTTRPARARIA
ncbi:hypothetical protein ACFQHV_20700 [Promicromonospora thailandica]|uniref:Uncharacterized protein n=1 Tax=Promicromonospora thailandica TaxID=765201 RepID=A0A9X2G6M1_9MICO|nr:hypothetical protein [Promicromonospora thailandica]MCP2264189.1 hypothetical protein [Promicromonospora thailandica]BFF21144.1 hypothetical protein GCM10025730_46650 [Promicromonospora thailandica]